MNSRLEAYRRGRDDLLTRIATELSNDERLAAAWLNGSHARNEADEVSDLDITLAVTEPYSSVLCARGEQVSHRTTDERLALFSQFGAPALIHENNNNAPASGTFTFVMYAETAVMVDWILVPLAEAERPHAREDQVFVTEWLEHLHGLVQDIERRMRREPWTYKRGSLSQLQPGREEQIRSIRLLCEKMQRLAPEAERFSGTSLALPLKEIETLLALVDVEHARH